MSDRLTQRLVTARINSPPLRVAMVASSLRLGGAEKQTVYMAKALFNAGIDLHFFFLGQGGYYEATLRKTGVPMHQIYSPKRPLIMLSKLMGALRQLRPHVVLAAQ